MADSLIFDMAQSAGDSEFKPFVKKEIIRVMLRLSSLIGELHIYANDRGKTILYEREFKKSSADLHFFSDSINPLILFVLTSTLLFNSSEELTRFGV